MNVHRLAAVASSVAVAVIVVVGLYFSGPPSEQRMARLDDERVMELRDLARSIENYWDDYDTLPVELGSLIDGRRRTSLPRDPETGADYEYEATSASSYRLCATFSRASNEGEEDFWVHDAGRQCFSFELQNTGNK